MQARSEQKPSIAVGTKKFPASNEAKVINRSDRIIVGRVKKMRVAVYLITLYPIDGVVYQTRMMCRKV